MSYGYSQPQYAAHAPPAYAYAPAGYAYAPPARRSAPPSVHVIALLQYLSGFGALVTAAIIGYFAYAASQETPHPSADIISPEGAMRLFGLAAAVIAVVGLITVFLGRKLQRGRQWARVLVLILNVLSIAGVVASIAILGAAQTWGVGAIYPVLCMVLLNTRAARSWFRWHTW
jgi:hypothetical protein